MQCNGGGAVQSWNPALHCDAWIALHCDVFHLGCFVFQSMCALHYNLAKLHCFKVFPDISSQRTTMHYIDQHWITLNTAKEVLQLSWSDVCTEMKSLVILRWPKQQQMIGIAVRAIHCILGSDYEETQKRETRRRETLNRIPARHLALHSGSDYEETQKRGTLQTGS